MRHAKLGRICAPYSLFNICFGFWLYSYSQLVRRKVTFKRALWMEHSTQVSVEAMMLDSTKASHHQEEEMSEVREFFTILQTGS